MNLLLSSGDYLGLWSFRQGHKRTSEPGIAFEIQSVETLDDVALVIQDCLDVLVVSGLGFEDGERAGSGESDDDTQGEVEAKASPQGTVTINHGNHPLDKWRTSILVAHTVSKRRR